VSTNTVDEEENMKKHEYPKILKAVAKTSVNFYTFNSILLIY